MKESMQQMALAIRINALLLVQGCITFSKQVQHVGNLREGETRSRSLQTFSELFLQPPQYD
jgi:hypothetical protein